MKQPVNIIIRLMLSLLVWPKVITLSGFYYILFFSHINRYSEGEKKLNKNKQIKIEKVKMKKDSIVFLHTKNNFVNTP